MEFGFFVGVAVAEGVAAINWICATAGFVAGEEIQSAGRGTDVAQVIGGEAGDFASGIDAVVLPDTGDGEDATEGTRELFTAAEGTGELTTEAEGTVTMVGVAEGTDTISEARSDAGAAIDAEVEPAPAGVTLP